MRQLREVLRLSLNASLSIRKISASTKISLGSIQAILKQAEQLGLCWPLPDDQDGQALALLFYRKRPLNSTLSFGLSKPEILLSDYSKIAGHLKGQLRP